MAWQNSAAMLGNGAGPPGGGEVPNSGQPQGTEYTLQGVMRFLQTEWHRHERDRNAWEIERAEMKARIGRLEGDGRTSKRLQESLGKHVKILENALKKEREKTRKLLAGETAEDKNAQLQLELEDLKNKPPGWRGPQQGEDSQENSELRQDAERDKSRLYLSKCVQEVTYHVIPTNLAQQAVPDPEVEHQHQNHQMQNHPSQPSMEEMYMSQRKPPQANSVPMMNSSIPYHRPPAPPVSELPPLARPSEHAAFPMARSNREIPGVEVQGVASSENRGIPRQNLGYAQVVEESLGQTPGSYDVYASAAANTSDQASTRTTETEVENVETDGWNFEDTVESSHESLPSHEFLPPQRPDTDAFPSAQNVPFKSPPRGPVGTRRRGSLSRRRQSDGSHELRELSLSQGSGNARGELSAFKVKFALRGHLDVVRSVIFTGGGTPAEPEVCTTGDDGVIKRWILPANYPSFGAQGTSSSTDLDISSYFTHRGHNGPVLCLAASPASQNFLNGGRALGDGWVFSGGSDATIRVWERGRVDPKATLDGHTDAVWTICVLPGTLSSALGDQSSRHGGPDRILLASGSADGTVLIWAVSSPPQLTSPSSGSRRGAGGSRRANSVSSGSNFPSSPQPSTATSTPFMFNLVHRIERLDRPSPTCIAPLSMTGESFVVGYNDASILIYDTRTAEEIVGMASTETYDGTPSTGVNTVAATTAALEGNDSGRRNPDDENISHGATGSSTGVEGMVLSGHEDRFIRFFDANSGQCTYNMLAHPSPISALSLSPDGRELVSAGHDASLRFWSLEKRSCTQEITSHRMMRGEGVCAVVWSADGRWVLSGGGDGTVKVWAR